MPASVCLGSVPKPPANWLTGSGSALPIPAVRVHLPAPPNPLQSSQNLFIPSQKFRPPFQRWRGRGAVRQRKFGFQTKLPGRKRPSSGVFSGFQPEARFARRPLSLPCGRGVGDPSPQAPPRQAGSDFLFSQPKVLLNFFQKIAVSKGRAFGRSSHCEPQRSVSERNRRRRLLARRSSEILYPVKRVFRVNCLAA